MLKSIDRNPWNLGIRDVVAKVAGVPRHLTGPFSKPDADVQMANFHCGCSALISPPAEDLVANGSLDGDNWLEALFIGADCKRHQDCNGVSAHCP